MSRVSSMKSTIVRSYMRFLSTTSPRRAERRAAWEFGVVRPAGSPGEPVAAGHTARAFRIDSGPRDLPAWEWGDGGEAPTVMLVHGWNGHAGQMGALAGPLVDAGFHVVAFDLPAHGRAAGRRTTLPEMARAVEGVARRLRPVHAIVAHSLGATASAIAVARGLDVRRLVLLAPPAEPEPFARAFARAIGLPDARVPGMLASLREEVGDFEALDLRRLAPAMSARLLLLHDPADREVPFAHARAIVERWPDARLATVEGAGHLRMLGDARVVRQAVSFLRELTPDSLRSVA